MALLAQHSYTIRRLIDGKTLTFMLESNQATTQIYTPDPATFIPNYVTAPHLVITPSLMIAGESGDQIAKLKAKPTWKINGSSTLTPFLATEASSSPYALTIKKNMEDVNQMKIECTAIYVQPATLIEMPITATLTFTKVSNTGANIIAVVTAPKGTIFKNEGAEPLEAEAVMWRGSTIDNTDVEYKWSRRISGVWTALTADNALGVSGFNTSKITIPHSAVLNQETFKCDIKDTDTGSSTHNQTVSDFISFIDMSDEYVIDTEFPLGDGIVSGGSTKVRVQVRQGVKRMDAEWFTGKTIKHFKYNAAGVLDNTWGTSGYKTADANREITITEADLNTGVQTAFGVELHG